MRKKSKTNGLIQRWFQTQMQHAYSNSMKDSIIETRSVDHLYFHQGLDIKVFFASNGGKIVKINKFDDNKESMHNNQKLYIINDGEDFGQSLNNIITLEALR